MPALDNMVQYYDTRAVNHRGISIMKIVVCVTLFAYCSPIGGLGCTCKQQLPQTNRPLTRNVGSSFQHLSRQPSNTYGPYVHTSTTVQGLGRPPKIRREPEFGANPHSSTPNPRTPKTKTPPKKILRFESK